MQETGTRIEVLAGGGDGDTVRISKGDREPVRRVGAARFRLCGLGRDRGDMLVDELGRALNGRHLRVWAYKVMAENALRRVRLYDARASCFTHLANGAVPDHLLARWARRTNVTTTKRWYVKPGVEISVRRRIRGEVWRVAPPPAPEEM
ncbi:hypothetical protein ACFT7S_00295 [Streptomyces sp. NPDC057136]|uniref:hypothetical protein n=1 Tax=Streptomyces sp. NPDC057136 TaxID=3346029 RepID=UPI003642FB63